MRTHDGSEPSLSCCLLFLPSSSLPRPRSPVPGLKTAHLQRAIGKAVEGSMQICHRICTEALWFCLFVVVLGIEFRASHTPGKHFTTGNTPSLYFQLPGFCLFVSKKKKNKLISQLGFFPQPWFTFLTY